MAKKLSNAQKQKDKLDVLGTAGKAVALRRKMRLSQTDFWRMVGVTQTAGSRYEAAAGPAWANARKIPYHVQAIGALVFAKDEQTRQSVVELLVCEKWFAMDVAYKGSEMVPSLPGVTVTDRAKPQSRLLPPLPAR
jgi:hypothetical protein